jgi:hypothetical protein
MKSLLSTTASETRKASSFKKAFVKLLTEKFKVSAAKEIFQLYIGNL